MIIAWLQRYAMLALGITLAGALAFGGLQTLRLANTNTEFANYKAATASLSKQRADTYAADMAAARATEARLNNEIDASRRKKDEQVAAINSRLRTALDSLRDRPEKRSSQTGSAASPAGTPEGATGANLSGPDGRFLAGEAARADTLRSALEQCYRDYDAARSQIKDYTDGLTK